MLMQFETTTPAAGGLFFKWLALQFITSVKSDDSCHLSLKLLTVEEECVWDVRYQERVFLSWLACLLWWTMQRSRWRLLHLAFETSFQRTHNTTLQNMQILLSYCDILFHLWLVKFKVFCLFNYATVTHLKFTCMQFIFQTFFANISHRKQ